MYPMPEALTATSAKGVRFHGISKELRDGQVLVMYADLPIGEKETEAETERRLDGPRDGTLARMKAKLISDKKIKLDGKYPGRELVADLPDGKGRLRSRFYLVGKRFYQLQVAGSKAFVDGPDTDKIFGSFKLAP
jgi:hypothetical protein